MLVHLTLGPSYRALTYSSVNYTFMSLGRLFSFGELSWGLYLVSQYGFCSSQIHLSPKRDKISHTLKAKLESRKELVVDDVKIDFLAEGQRTNLLFLLLAAILWLAHEQPRAFWRVPGTRVFSATTAQCFIICFRKHHSEAPARATSKPGNPETVSPRNRQKLAKEKLSTSEKVSKSPPLGR